MKTININGKEYTENEFTRKCKKHKILLDGSLSMIFDELKEKFPRQQPEPPTLRPMSEVKFGSAIFLLQSENNIKSWQNGYFNDDMFQEAIILDQGGSFKQSNDYKGTYGQILGWLPSLPNPDETKLP
jgi:hypothetical protein